MLDGIEPEGMDTLNTVAGYGLGTAIVAAVIAATIGVYLWLGGKFGKFSGDKSAKGLNSLWLACLGVTFISGASSAIAWGASTGGTENLMPEAAQPQDITVNREAPVSTCDLDSAVRDFEEEDDGLDYEERMEIFAAVAAGAEGTGIGGPDYDEVVQDINEFYNSADEDHEVIRTLVWTPEQSVGQNDCDGRNLTSSPGTEVTVEYAPFYDESLDDDEGLASATLEIPEADEE